MEKTTGAFVTLSQSGKYHSAAEKIYVTQPTLTNQIQMLETLFQRGRHGAKMTVVGEKLRQEALDAVDCRENS